MYLNYVISQLGHKKKTEFSNKALNDYDIHPFRKQKNT